MQYTVFYANLIVTCYLDLGNRGKLLEGYLKRYCLQKSIMYSNSFKTYREVKLQNGKEF